jgi:hypothetical protein
MVIQASVAVAQQQNAPIRWEVADGGNGHLYQAILCPEELGGISWDEADSITTMELDGDWHLATATSAGENAFLYDLVDDDIAFWVQRSSGNGSGPFLGGFSSCISCNDWQWVTGEPWSYTNWGPSEPFSNGDGLGLFGHQVSMGPKWNDVPKSRPRTENGYILECPEDGDCPAIASGGCPGVAPVPVEGATWGAIKSRY